MSKKLIAVASAAALALTALVGIAPASATAPVAALTKIGAGDGSTSAAAATVTIVRANATAATVSGMPLNLTALATGDVVRITATGGVRLLGGAITGSGDVDVTKAGVTEVDYTHSTAVGATSTTKVYTAYTKSTATGTIVVNVVRTGLTYNKTLYLKGVHLTDVEYNITAVTGIPATLAANAKADVTFKVTDAFGNAVENDASIQNVATVQLAGANNATAPAWDATLKLYKVSITSPTSGTFIVEVRANATDPSVAGLVDADWRFVSVVNNPATATANAAATAQIAALTAQLANSRGKDVSVTKKRYNNLAKRWNSAFPGQKVKLKK